MNLLSESRQNKLASRIAKRRWRIICLTIFIGLACWSWLEYHTMKVLAAERDALERQFAPLRSVKASNKRISKDCEQLRTKEQFAIDLANDLPAINFLKGIEDAATECQGDLFLKELVFQRQSGRANVPAADRPATILIRGLGENNLAIAKFAAALRDSRLFLNVELAASESQKIVEKSVQEFELNCTLQSMETQF